MIDPLTQLLADALRSAVHYLDARTDDNTSDDDVRAIEAVSDVLHRVPDADRERLVAALGPETAGWFDLEPGDSG